MATAPLGHTQPAQAHLAANAAGLQAENAAKILNGVHTVCVDHMGFFGSERRWREQGHSLISYLGPHLRCLA
jgi:hypothetical protein